MRSPIQPNLVAAVILFAAAVVPGSALAELSEADKTGINAFSSCLGEPGEKEDTCLEKLGRYAWYPKSGACEAIAALVHKAITDVNQAEWRDLFFNERCSRLAMPHDKEAAAAGDTNPETSETSPEGQISRRIFTDCKDSKHWKDDFCFEAVGRYRWYDEDIYCAITRDLVEIAAQQREIQSWKLLFKNERCHRRDVWHYEPAQ